MVLVITSVATEEVLERWAFDIECDKVCFPPLRREQCDWETIAAVIPSTPPPLPPQIPFHSCYLGFRVLPTVWKLRRARRKSRARSRRSSVRSQVCIVVVFYYFFDPPLGHLNDRSVFLPDPAPPAASVTFLPMLDEPCTFDLLVYTGMGINSRWVPARGLALCPVGCWHRCRGKPLLCFPRPPSVQTTMWMCPRPGRSRTRVTSPTRRKFASGPSPPRYSQLCAARARVCV